MAKESFKIDSEYLDKVRNAIKPTRQTISGYIELAIEEKISRDKRKTTIKS